MQIAKVLRDAGYSEETIHQVLTRKPVVRRDQSADAPRPDADVLSKMGHVDKKGTVRSFHSANFELNLKSVWAAGSAAWKLSEAESFSGFLFTLVGATLGLGIKTFSDIESAVVDCVHTTCQLPMATGTAFAATQACLKTKSIDLTEGKFEETLTTLASYQIFEIRGGDLHLCQTIVGTGKKQSA